MERREQCTICGAAMLSVLYYGADGDAIGGYFVCSNCGPRSVVEMTPPEGQIRRDLLERKAS